MPQTTYPTGPVPASVQRWARMARVFAPPTVIGSLAQNPYGLTVGGLNATIGRGVTGAAESWVRAFFHVLDGADWTVAVPPNAHATQARIDRIVLRWNPATEDAQLTLLQGTPAATPVPAPMTQDDAGVWDLPLWRFTVPANNGAPLTAVVDERRFFDPVVGNVTSHPRTPISFAVTRTYTGTGTFGNGMTWDGGSAVIPNPGVPDYTIQWYALTPNALQYSATSGVPSHSVVVTVGQDNGAGGFVPGTTSTLPAGAQWSYTRKFTGALRISVSYVYTGQSTGSYTSASLPVTTLTGTLQFWPVDP
jgi:hypothetical protein